jgi:hypothetical protein
MKKIFGIVFLMSFSVQAFSADLTCIGKIDAVNTAADGYVAIISSEMFGDSAGRTVCNLNVGGAVTVDACRSWVSQALASYASKTNFRVVYLNSAHSSCSALPSWSFVEKPASLSNWF